MDTQEVPPDLVLLFHGLGGVIEDGGPFVLLLVCQPPAAQSFRLLELFVGELFVGLGLSARHLGEEGVHRSAEEAGWLLRRQQQQRISLWTGASTATAARGTAPNSPAHDGGAMVGMRG